MSRSFLETDNDKTLSEIARMADVSYSVILKHKKNDPQFPKSYLVYDQNLMKNINLYKNNDVITWLNRNIKFDNRLAQLFIRGLA